MKTRSFITIILTAATAAGSAIAGCSGSNNPSNPSGTDNSTGNSTSNNTSGNSSTTSTANSTGSSTSTGASSAAGSSASVAGGTDGGLPACASGLQDKITTCTATDVQQCVKGCGPDLPAGSTQGSTLGTKTCTCMTGVYQCANCNYLPTLPLCYMESATPSVCEAGTADKLACTTPCTTGTGNDVCTLTTDAGKSDGCVCIVGSTGNVWTCATLPW